MDKIFTIKDSFGQGFIPLIGGKPLVYMTPFYSDAEIQALITSGYRPVATHQDLNAVRSTSSRVWAAGTKWETGSLAGGLSLSYIQVADIDLTAETRTGGAYDNGGAGWVGIGTFAGTYDGGGHIIKGCYINRPSNQSYGFFMLSTSAATIRNLFLKDVDFTAYRYSSPLAGGLPSGVILVENCIVSGVATYNPVAASNGDFGGICGRPQNSNVTIRNCINLATINGGGGTRIGGLVGWNNGGNIINSYSVGLVDNVATNSGGLVGLSYGTITDCYYDSETSGQSDTGKGTPLTTAQMLALNDANWDTDIWKFGNGFHYPYLKAFRKRAINMPPPENLATFIDGTDVSLSWSAPLKGVPDSYNIYGSKDNGAWTLLYNEVVLEALHADPAAGTWRYFVKAVYNGKETGNSNVDSETIT